MVVVRSVIVRGSFVSVTSSTRRLGKIRYNKMPLISVFA